MFKRLSLVALLLASLLAIDVTEAEAARRRGGFFMRARQTRNYRTSSVKKQTTSNQSAKLHQTHSRSAVLDGFFGPYSGGQGHDRSWYVGK